MNVLVFNCGSSSFKFKLINFSGRADATRDQRKKRLAEGTIESIGKKSEVRFSGYRGPALEETSQIEDHQAAVRKALHWLTASDLLEELDAVGHRIVHGGERLVGPMLLGEESIRAIEGVSELAPLHNGPALSAIRAARAYLGRSLPMVAIFDTDFHRSLPDRSSRYAIPLDLAEKYHIRRFGFHGIAHRYMLERYARIKSTPKERAKLVTLQLGSGCSAAAIEGGHSVDTTMGLTPLEGLMMATRSGDVDPSLAGYLAKREHIPVAQVESLLNYRSGLLGVSGSSSEIKDLLEAENRRGDLRARMAIEMFCYRVKKCIGSYLACLGGADAIIFGGGIGENAPVVRSRICEGLEWLGISLDEELNGAPSKSDRLVSAHNSRVAIYVVPIDEEELIATDTVSTLLAMKKKEYTSGEEKKKEELTYHV